MSYLANVAAQVECLKGLRFGIEIETVGANRETLARKLAAALPGASAQVYNSYGSWSVKMADGREWRVVHDGSLSGVNNGEVVSPILTYADMDLLQTIVRALREDAKAKADDSCGIHVHVDGARFTQDPRGLARLASLVYSQEEIIVASLRVQDRRLNRYTRKVDPAFIERLKKAEQKGDAPAVLNAIRAAWYGRETTGADRYDQSRYHGLNLNSFFYRGTVEFRYFEGTLHAGKVKAYIQLCLALVAMAIRAKKSIARKRAYAAASAKYDMRVFLLRLCMSGAEFKTARYHLIDGLPGDAAYKAKRASRRGPGETSSTTTDSVRVETTVTREETRAFLNTILTRPAGAPEGVEGT